MINNQIDGNQMTGKQTNEQTNKQTNRQTVNINPSNFSEDGGLLDLSLEEVVNLFQTKEKNRHRDAKDNENELEDMITCRTVPMGLMMALDGNARRLGITRSMLTRCASHQIVAWIDSLTRINEITGIYNIACDAAEEFGYPDLYESMAASYMFSSSTYKSVSFRTIKWVKNKLYAVSPAIGVPVGSLFIVGLCYAATRSGNATRGTISKYLSTEVSKFVRHVDERSVWVVGFNDLLRRRAKDDGII